MENYQRPRPMRLVTVIYGTGTCRYRNKHFGHREWARLESLDGVVSGSCHALVHVKILGHPGSTPSYDICTRFLQLAEPASDLTFIA